MNYYNSIAKGYGELYKEEQLQKLSIIKNNVKISKNAKILDVGCGTGISSDFDCFVVGLDPSIELISQSNNSAKLLAIAEYLPFKNNSFDYVISLTAIHNFIHINKSINEMKRVCSEKIIISVLNKSGKFNFIKKLIEKNLKVEKTIDEGKDTIFFCKK